MHPLQPAVLLRVSWTGQALMWGPQGPLALYRTKLFFEAPRNSEEPWDESEHVFIDLVCDGSPVHALRMPEPEREAMKESKGKPKKDRGPKPNASNPSHKTGAIATAGQTTQKKKKAN